MLNSQRIFVQAIKTYCADQDISVELRAEGWLIIMQRGERRHFAFGYDIGLNSAVAHRIANDKSATADVLEMVGIARVPHTVFLNPQLNAFIPPVGSWEAMLKLLKRHPSGIVVKPNEGTSGKSVFFVSTRPALELAVNRIFASHLSLAISPCVAIEDEVRVVLIDDVPAVVYEKSRPAIVGDGKHSLLELALTTLSIERRSTVLPGMLADLDKAALDAIPPTGQGRVLNWRHNLETGAQPRLLARGGVRDACVRLAVSAAQAIGIRFASVDLVRVGEAWQVLEVNSGVMMESLARHYPELVFSIYHAALDKVFGEA